MAFDQYNAHSTVYAIKMNNHFYILGSCDIQGERRVVIRSENDILQVTLVSYSPKVNFEFLPSIPLIEEMMPLSSLNLPYDLRKEIYEFNFITEKDLILLKDPLYFMAQYGMFNFRLQQEVQAFALNGTILEASFSSSGYMDTQNDYIEDDSIYDA